MAKRIRGKSDSNEPVFTKHFKSGVSVYIAFIRKDRLRFRITFTEKDNAFDLDDCSIQMNLKTGVIIGSEIDKLIVFSFLTMCMENVEKREKWQGLVIDAISVIKTMNKQLSQVAIGMRVAGKADKKNYIADFFKKFNDDITFGSK